MIRIRNLVGAAWVVPALVAAAGSCGQAGSRPRDGVNPIMEQKKPAAAFELAGQQSGITQSKNVVIRDAAAWAALWREHTRGAPEAPVPAVDFKKMDVVAVFLGSKPTGGYTVNIEAIRRTRTSATIPVTANAPGPGTIVTQAFTQPFAMRAVAKLPSSARFVVRTVPR